MRPSDWRVSCQRWNSLSNLYWQLVRLGFHLLYNEMAWTYDAVAWLVSLGEWGKWRRAAIPFLQGKRILELAHGTGHLLATLRGEGFDVVGMDLSPEMGRIARRRTKGNVPLVQGGGQALPFQANAFDSVVVTFPTAFILEPETLFNLRRVLREEGCVVIVPSGALNGHGIVERLIDWAFAATGQRGGGDVFVEWGERFAAVGFYIEMEKVDLGRSWVVVLTGNLK